MLTKNDVAYGSKQLNGVSGEFLDCLSPEALRDFHAMLHASSYVPGMILFSEKEEAEYVYFVLSGEVKLSMNSSDGRRLILHIARKGELLGVAPAVAGESHQATAEPLYPAKLAPIERGAFVNFLARHPEANQIVMKDLGRLFSMACEQLRMVGLAASAPEKLARLLLDWSEHGQTTESGTRFRFSLTHSEIGEFIGASRETVTRTLSRFKNRRLVDFHGSMLTISNKSALEAFARG